MLASGQMWKREPRICNRKPRAALTAATTPAPSTLCLAVSSALRNREADYFIRVLST